MSRWYDGIEPVTVSIPCGGAVHRLTWRRGKLVLEDHHLTAERAVQAMGGAPCPCAVVLDAWSAPRHVTRPLVHLLSLVDEADEIGSYEVLQLPPPEPPSLPSGLTRDVAEMWRRTQRETWLRRTVVSLPTPLVARWLLGVVMGADRRWYDTPGDERVDAAELLLRRARRCVVKSMRSWRRLDGVSICLDSRLIERDGKRELSGYINSRQAAAVVQVPLSWFVTVWARSRAVVDGCFVLDATDGPDGVEATVVRWERITASASEAVTVPARLWRNDDGTWRLRWA